MKEQNKQDELVLQLFNKVRDKQREINQAEKPKWVTSCTIGQNPDSVNDRVNIQTVTDVDKLIHLFSFIEQKRKDHYDTCLQLSLKRHFKWMGYSAEEWKADIKTRVDQLSINEKKRELSALEERLEKLISTEQRREMELAEIQKMLA